MKAEVGGLALHGDAPGPSQSADGWMDPPVPMSHMNPIWLIHVTRRQLSLAHATSVVGPDVGLIALETLYFTVPRVDLVVERESPNHSLDTERTLSLTAHEHCQLLRDSLHGVSSLRKELDHRGVL